jgi:hypothetical protein
VAENWIQSMNRCTGPEPCQCPITGPHQADNQRCPRNVLAAVLASRRKANASGQGDEDSAQILAAAAGVRAPHPAHCQSCGACPPQHHSGCTAGMSVVDGEVVRGKTPTIDGEPRNG